MNSNGQKGCEDFPHAEVPVHYNTGEWIRDNEKFFLPPVCNKMMHNTQLKVFYVGGPNQRADYHLEEGEELFYMRKGNMCLKILEQGVFKDVHIKHGEIFLLPGKIPHSPQREAETVGLVIERERMKDVEFDGLRYYKRDGTTDSLFERWFYCSDLGTQLPPVIKEFFASEENKTGQRTATSIPKTIPWREDEKRTTEEPFPLENWLDQNSAEIAAKGQKALFEAENYQTDVLALGQGSGKRALDNQDGELFLWCVRGSGAQINVGEKSYEMKLDDTILVPENQTCEFIPGQDKNCIVLSVKMSPKNKQRPQ